jgi:thiol-disulfide isomerase/thioredoxin
VSSAAPRSGNGARLQSAVETQGSVLAATADRSPEAGLLPWRPSRIIGARVPMKQQCHMAMIYFTWVFYLGGLAYLLYRSMWPMAIAWLVCIPLFEWLYIRQFRGLSQLLGYGRIVDQPATTVAASKAEVTFYTALGCPFCPLMEQRLDELQKESGFTLHKIDVTLRPDLLMSKGIRSVPAIETGGKVLFGLITKKDLAAAIG